MKNSCFLFAMLCAGNLLFTVSTSAVQEKPSATGTQLSSQPTETNYTKAIEGRTAAILQALALTDTNQIARVHDIIMAQWRALNAWHKENDAKLKAAQADTNAVAQIQESLKELHRHYIAALSEYLTPAQIEIVKDKMNAEKAKILELLKEGREEAMDGGSSHEKAMIMKRYKGKINLYLTGNGHDVAKAYKDWGARQKIKTTAAVTNSAPAP